MESLLFRILLLAVLLACTPHLRADAPVANQPPADADTELHKVQGIFDSDLPKTQAAGTIKLIIHPHLGDFTSRSYLRLPLGFRAGFNDHLEVSATVESYFQHYLRRDHPGNGVGSVSFGGKYLIRDWLLPEYGVSAGINVRMPVGHPPVDLTDGYNHYAPFLTIATKPEGTPGLTYFFNPGLDIMRKSSVAGQFRKNDVQSSSILLSAGLVYDRFPYHFTLEAGYQTTSLIGHDNKQFFFARPGFALDLPGWAKFGSRARWIVGLGTKITIGPDGTRFDTGGKIRGEFSLKRMFGGGK